MNKKKIIIFSVILGILLLSGTIICSCLMESGTKVGYVGNSYGNTLNASFYYFDGIESKKVKFDKGDKVTIVYSIELEKGALQVNLKDQAGKEIFSKSEGSGEATFTVNETQNYSINIIASKAKGKYNLTWSK